MLKGGPHTYFLEAIPSCCQEASSAALQAGFRQGVGQRVHGKGYPPLARPLPARDSCAAARLAQSASIPHSARGCHRTLGLPATQVLVAPANTEDKLCA